MDTRGNGLRDTLLNQKRVELAALSRQLRHEHSQLREAYIILVQDSRQLSEESKLLRAKGQTSREGVDEFACLLAPSQHS